MHPYSTDSHERKNIVLAIAVVSVGFAYAFHQAVESLGLKVPWWIDAPSVMSIFGVLYEVFDKWLWRLRFLRKVGVVKVPNLNGEWEGEGQSSFNETRYQVRVTIRQRWTSLRVFLESENSMSRSLTASVLVEQPEGPTLSYEYRNDPKPNAPSTMHSHRGTAILRLKSENELNGEYYSGRDRVNYGSITLRRVGHAC